MIKYVTGDLLDANEKFIVHGCNAQGVMRSGVAKAIRDKWPQAYDAYKAYERREGLDLGDIILATTDKSNQYVVNMITQQNFGRTGLQYVSYDAIADGMNALKDHFFYTGFKNPTIAMPRIGAGLGGGDWKIIAAIIDAVLSDYDITIYDLETPQ